MIPQDVYLERIKKRQSPQKDLIVFLLNELEVAANSTKFDEFDYTANVEAIRKTLKDVELTPLLIGRTLKVFFDEIGLKKDKDYVKGSGGGGSARYHLFLSKEKLESIREKTNEWNY